MASTYKIFLPNGNSALLPYGELDEKMRRVDAILEHWKPYLDGNWISTNYTDVLCGENKVKRLLDGLAYYLLLGNGDVSTDYKELIKGKMEVPMSSCPSHIGEMMYGIGAVARNDEPPSSLPDSEFAMKKKTKIKKRLPSQRRANLEAIKRRFGDDVLVEYRRVDTQNNFSFDGSVWHIDESVSEYSPKRTDAGILYDMDTVVIVKSKLGYIYFFNADYSEIDEACVKKI